MEPKGMYEEEKLDKAVEVTNDYLPEDAELLSLSLCGSRAFGWGLGYDYDIHGIFYCPEFWGWCHSGKKYDLNMYNMMEKVQREVRRNHFSFFMNMSNPFYLDERLHFDEMMDLMSDKIIGGKTKWEIARFENAESVRSALHSYRVCLQCLHYLKEDEMEIDVRKLADIYGYDRVHTLAEEYMDKGNNCDVDSIKDELYEIESKVNEYELRDNKDEDKIEDWIEGVLNEFK